MSDIRTVGVLGGGLMGGGIAQVAAQSGFVTKVREISDAIGQRAKSGIEKQLNKAIEKGKLTADKRDEALGRLSFTTDVGELKDCDIVIEAVVENLEGKKPMWEEVDAPCPEH